MSEAFLSRNQRELIKFMKPYVLCTKSKKKSSRSQRLESDFDYSLNVKVHSAEEVLLDFNPDENEIDGKLYDEIVELDTQPVRDSR